MINKVVSSNDGVLAVDGAQKIAKELVIAIHHRNLDPELLVFIRRIALQSKIVGSPAAKIMKYFTDYVYNSGKFCPDAIVKIAHQLNLIIKNEY